MNPSKFAEQLLKELPVLIARKVINEETAAGLKQYFEPQVKKSHSLSIGLTISAVLGALLIGSGIILLLAHNWDALTHPVRAGIALLPLLISIAFGAYTILRRSDSAAWREGSAAFYFLSIGASIALVSQTYHLYNDLNKFLLVWLFLSLPLIYLLRSGMSFIGGLACIVGYYVNQGGVFSIFTRWPLPHASAWLFLLLILPFYVWLIKKQRESLTTVWVSAGLTVALWLMTMIYIDRVDDNIWGLPLSGLFAVYYAFGSLFFPGQRGWRNPLRGGGALGIAVVATIYTFLRLRDYGSNSEAFRLTAGVIVFWIVTLICLVVLVAELCRVKRSFNIVAVLLPCVLAITIFWMPYQYAYLFINSYMLILGVYTLVRGVKRDSLLSMNEGLLLIATLIVCRFFDQDYSFVVRGLAFIIVGCGFLGMNIWIFMTRRRKKEVIA